MALTLKQTRAIEAFANRLVNDPDLLDRLAPIAPAVEPAIELPPTVTGYEVRSGRDGAHVCGPYKKKGDAEREQKRLNHEARDLAPGALAEEATAIGLDAARPNTYRVVEVQVPKGVIA